MGLKDLGVQLLEYEQGLMVNNDFLVIHGNLVSVHSSYTAKRLHEKHVVTEYVGIPIEGVYSTRGTDSGLMAGGRTSACAT